MESDKRNLAFLFIGAGLYLAIGHALSFISAGAILLAALGYAIVRASAREGRRDNSGYLLLIIGGLVLLVNHWVFMLGIVIAAIAWFWFRTRRVDQTFASFAKHNIAGSIRWGKGESWAVRSSELSVAIAEIQIDLTNAFFEEPEVTLRLQGVIGDIDIVVPEDVGLSVSANVTLGQIQVSGERGAGFMNSLQWRTPHYETAEHKVRLNITYVVGDIDVKVL